MNIKREIFGTMANGEKVERFWVENDNGMRVGLIGLGAAIQSLFVPDKSGGVRDVAVGFDDCEGFETRSDYQGVIAGPYANRIGGGAFSIDGVHYALEKNEDGVKTLHGCGEYSSHIWDGEVVGDDTVRFSYRRPDGLHGYPGAIDAAVCYTLTQDDRLVLSYTCVSDKKTYINPTNHIYFNLAGFDGGDILSHLLRLNASRFTPVDAHSIPLGGSAPVAGTPFDFRSETAIGARIDCADEQLGNTGGYDHNFCIDGWDGTLREAAAAFCPASGIALTVSTTLPGVQFYSGNFLKGARGKGDLPMEKRSGFCLETQYYPDTPNRPEFPSCLFGAGETYRSQTVFAFSVRA